MPISVQRASLADVRSISSILMRSFRPLPQYQSLYDIDSCAGDLHATALKEDEIRSQWHAAFSGWLCDPQWYNYTAVDEETDAVIGFSAWLAPKGSSYRRRSLSLHERLLRWWYTLRSDILGRLPLALRALWLPSLGRPYLERRLVISRKTAGLNVKYLDERERKEGYWYLVFLCVDPAYERRGIGRQLLKEGFEMADADDSTVWLTSSPTGKGMYERLGFRTFESVQLQGGRYGDWEEHSMRLARLSERRKDD